MYKLYRIKEIKHYKTMFEYDKYNTFCNEMKDAVHKFVNNIDKDYLVTSKQAKPHATADEIITRMDDLMLNGFSYDEASNIIKNEYL